MTTTTVIGPMDANGRDDGWGYETPDTSVGIWGGVYHEHKDERDMWTDCEPCPEIISTEQVTEPHPVDGTATLRDEYLCSCGGRLVWEYVDFVGFNEEEAVQP